MTGTRFVLEVQPKIPQRLERLAELANDLLYSWDRQVRDLFHRLDHELWEACGHNPKVLLRRVAQERLEQAAEDRIYLEDYERTLGVYDRYHQEPMRPEIKEVLDPDKDLVAYFCAEFGFHESVRLYSGGLGILAGDYCKAASDLRLPFVAVGLLYRVGYFGQTIDAQGNQVAHYMPTDFADLPVSPAHDARGNDLHVRVDMQDRPVHFKVWQAKAGHIRLYLLDSDIAENREEDRRITHQLYGGDKNTRMQQEIALGIGGVRALRALGISPTIWHVNEGHPAFLILELCREHVAQGLEFDAALEAVAAATVFTTHTPVPAGHDIFEPEVFTAYFDRYATEDLHAPVERLLALGRSPGQENRFNMTAFALRGSRFHNGVSRVHGGVAAVMESYVWPQIPPEENPIGYVTNGVHVPTFLASEWVNLFDMRFQRVWRNELLNEAYWTRIDQIPDQSFWSVRQTLKSELLEDVRQREIRRCQRNGCSASLTRRSVRYLSARETDILVIGFARRFATYKRATLLFSDPARLARLLSNPERPVLFLFAGKAHPHDLPGQQLIRTIHEYSRQPEFLGKIILIEDHDLALARRLVTGVDVWLNNPQYPLEASGTSGQKAGINGVINLSVLDGWWAEGYNGENGWAISPHDPHFDPEFRDREESAELLDILEQEVVRMYYERNGHGFSDSWVAMSKASMKSILPRFNNQRMALDYIKTFYAPAGQRYRRLAKERGAPARALTTWKSKVRDLWPGVRLRRMDVPTPAILAGESLPIRVLATLNGLTPDDVRVECLVGKESEGGELVVREHYLLRSIGDSENGETLFVLDFMPKLPGLQYYKLRVYPHHPLLTHPLEMGLMVWL